MKEKSQELKEDHVTVADANRSGVRSPYCSCVAPGNGHGRVRVLEGGVKFA